MDDLIYVALALVLFLIAWGFVRACAALKE
jgi:hypothetical protein